MRLLHVNPVRWLRGVGGMSPLWSAFNCLASGVSRKPGLVVSCVIAFLMAGWLVADRLGSLEAREPLAWDEIITLENYTWAGFERDGFPRRVSRADELVQDSRPSFLQLIAGLYRAVSVWREPNDHVLNSVLVNFSTAVFPGRIFAVRLPAWLGALVFLGFISVLAWHLGYRNAWPLSLLLSAGSPYVDTYSQLARGYSWMLALQVALVIVVVRLAARRPSSLVLGALGCVLASLSFLNTINLVLDWLMPLYLALWCFPPERFRSNNSEAIDVYRKALLIQALFVFSFSCVFFLHVLPYVVISLRLFGVPVDGSGFFSGLGGVLSEIFPGPFWTVVALVGCAGWYLMFMARETRTIGGLCLFVVGVSLLHFIVSQKLPYARACGYIIPLVILGATHVAEAVIQRVRRELQQTLTAIAAILIGAIVLHGHSDSHTGGSALAEFKRTLGQTVSGTKPYLTQWDPSEGWVRQRHAPAEAANALDRPEQVLGITHLAFVVDPTIALRRWSAGAAWQQCKVADRILQVRAAKAKYAEERTPPAQYPAVVIWTPPASNEVALQISRSGLLDKVSVKNQKHWFIAPSRWEFVNQMYSVEFLIDTKDEFEAALKFVDRVPISDHGAIILIEAQGEDVAVPGCHPPH